MLPRARFALALLLLAPAARAQEPALPTPGKEHALLASDVGTWEAAIKMYGPPGEPAVEKGSETNTLLPGGLWVLSEFTGTIGGQPFSGRGQTSYDPASGKYVGTWIDSMSTKPMLLEGSYDEATGTLTMEGESVGFDGKPARARLVTTHKPDGSRHFTMHMKSDVTGPDFVKMLEITYTKKK
jgi:hypothetical protein